MQENLIKQHRKPHRFRFLWYSQVIYPAEGKAARIAERIGSDEDEAVRDAGCLTGKRRMIVKV